MNEHILRSLSCLGRVGETLICLRLSESDKHIKMLRVITERTEKGLKTSEPIEGNILN